ncbi:hypothetical protein V5F34_08665 [Xanthobacter autotrophicus]|uniref:hypothetical protein n=1 Tax=Xanthobacter autotrophicus TaxID=280 RepID=UPI003729599C
MNDNTNLPAMTRENAIGLKMGSGRLISITTAAEASDFARMMASADVGIPKYMRGRPGICLAVTVQAVQWGADPFQVANKSYLVNDRIGYEAQLYAALLLSSGLIKGRPRYTYDGEPGSTRRCTVTMNLVEGGDPVVYTSPQVGKITPKNSPLWKTDEDQQLAYYSVRACGRRDFPDVMLGFLSNDEAAALPVDATAPKETTPVKMSTVNKLDALAGPGGGDDLEHVEEAEVVDPTTGEIIPASAAQNTEAQTPAEPEKPKPRGRRAAPKTDAPQPSTAESEQQAVAAAVAHPTVQSALDAFPGAEVRDVRPLETKGQNDASAVPWEPEAVDDDSDPFADLEEDDDEQVDPEIERIQIRMAELDHAPRGIDPDDISQCRQYLAGIDAASKGMPISAIPSDLRVDERKVEGRAWMAGHDSVTGSSPAARKAAKEARSGAAQRQ